MLARLNLNHSYVSYTFVELIISTTNDKNGDYLEAKMFLNISFTIDHADIFG